MISDRTNLKSRQEKLLCIVWTKPKRQKMCQLYLHIFMLIMPNIPNDVSALTRFLNGAHFTNEAIQIF